MNRVLVLIACIILGGCATMRRHPYATAVVTGVIATSIALSLNHHEAGRRVPLRLSPCAPQGLTECDR